MNQLDSNGADRIRKESLPQRMLYGSEAERLVLESIRRQRLFGADGPNVRRLEEGFSALYGAKHAVAVSSGTAAVHAALASLDLDPGSEVVTAPITDAGTIVPILFQGCVPVFADVDENFAMDPKSIESNITDATRAIIVVHLFGNAAKIDVICSIADRYGIPVIEDCSQAHATMFAGRFLGRHGRIGTFSLQESKHMSTGDGGIVITDDDALAARMRLFRDKGWDRDREGIRSYPVLGLNYRLTDLQAAVGIPQLNTIRASVLRRQELGDYLTAKISSIRGIHPHMPTPGSEHSYWQYAFRVTSCDPAKFSQALASEGIPTLAGYIGEPIYRCMDALARNKTFGSSGYPLAGRRDWESLYGEGVSPRAEELLRQIVVFGLHEGMTRADMDDVALAIAKVAKSLG